MESEYLKKGKNLFENLFVLELANNHWGSVERGKQIISSFAEILKKGQEIKNAIDEKSLKVAIKLQIRDVDNFIHKDFKESKERYIKKTMDTKMSYENYKILVEEIRNQGFIPMSTAFDERSVELCEKLGIEIIKIASSDIDCWPLLNKMAETKKPVIVSTGASSLEDIDKIVEFFKGKDIPLAVNHCVALYPTEKEKLELNQIDFLKNRYPENIIGYSTHEYNDGLEISTTIAYSKGARTFERHIDIEYTEAEKKSGKKISPYCSKPEQLQTMIQDFIKATDQEQLNQMIEGFTDAEQRYGSSSSSKTVPSTEEIDYIYKLKRGWYFKENLKKGHTLTKEDLYLAVPWQKKEGQICCSEPIEGRILSADVKKDCSIKDENLIKVRPEPSLFKSCYIL